MSESVTGETASSTDSERSIHLEQAIRHLEAELRRSDMNFGQWTTLQQHYYGLLWASVSRDVANAPAEEMKFTDETGFGGHGTSTGHVKPHDADLDADVVAILTTPARLFGRFAARDPNNPTTKHWIHLDHVVDSDGSVEVQIEGVPLDEVGDRPGSFVR